MKSTIDILCRIIRNNSQGTITELRGAMIAHGRNMRNTDKDIACIIQCGLITIEEDKWKIQAHCPLWATVSKRLDDASDTGY
jgi:predicted transcriptional regulator